jgi:predicted oxidoreductase
MPTPAQLRRFTRAVLELAKDPQLAADLVTNKDVDADTRLWKLFEQARGPLSHVVAEELRDRYDWPDEAQFNREVSKWCEAGFSFDDAAGWIRETSNVVAAKMLAERGWTPRLHKHCRIDGMSICHLLSINGMDPKIIPTLEYARQSKRKQRR